MNDHALTSAQQALEDAKLLNRDLVLARDEIRQLREQLIERGATIDHLRNEIKELHNLLLVERTRTNRWIVMGTKLTAGIGLVNTIAQDLKTTAIEAAQTLAERDLESELTTEEKQELQKLAGTTPLPTNELRRAEA